MQRSVFSSNAFSQTSYTLCIIAFHTFYPSYVISSKISVICHCKLSADDFGQFFQSKVDNIRMSTASADPPVIVARQSPSLSSLVGAGTGGAGWASAHPGKNQGGHGPPWKF